MRVIVGDLWAQPGLKVIPTNLKGVMGRGLAKQARDKDPVLEARYKEFLRLEALDGNPSRSLFFRDDLILFPVKNHWSDQVDVDLVSGCLDILTEPEWGQRVFVPALGCGFGEGDPLVLLPLIVSKLDAYRSSLPDLFTLVLASPEVGTKYAASLRPGSRTDRRW